MYIIPHTSCWVMQMSCFVRKIMNMHASSCRRITMSLVTESTTFVSSDRWWHHSPNSVLAAWQLFRIFVIYRGDWLSIKFCENDSFRKSFLFFDNTLQYLDGISQDISVSHFDSRRLLSSANRRQSTSPMLFVSFTLWSAWQEDPNDPQERCAIVRTSCAKL